MAIPRTIEDIVDKNFGIDKHADSTEIETWLILLPMAASVVYDVYAKRENTFELAQDEYELTYAKEFKLTDKELKVTARKLLAKNSDKVVEAKEKLDKAEREATFALKGIESFKKKSRSVRKIASIRANIQFIAEVDYTIKTKVF